MDCPACGHANPSGARFCKNCGTLLMPEQPASREERKVVTVFFADLVGFTGRAEQLDPEDVRAMLSPYYARLRSEIERFGGTVEKFIGDAVMAVFGAPVAHEDDPERAVRAALAVRDAVQELNDQNPALDLHVRIAVNTGEAVVSLGARVTEGEGMVAGDVVNTAARLQTAAPVDGILVGETTYRATERVVEYRDCEPVEAKGKAEPIPVWEALEARARYGVDVAQRGGAELVGRRQELEVLLEALARVERERTPQLVTLVGVPGIGKSRLVWELARAVDEDSNRFIVWRQGRSLPYGEGVAFWALAEMVKAQAGILETDSSEVAETKLRETVSDLVPDAGEAHWVETQLRRLVGVSTDEERGGDRRDESFAAWRRFFEALAEQRPAVLVFEDLHWADDNLLDFVDHLVDWATDSPLLVLGTARPELLERRPGWGGGKPNATTMSLSPLSEEDTARLISSLLEETVMPAEKQALLLSRAGGNPLYAEEYARMVAGRGIAPTEDTPLPETVQGIVAARLDALSPDEKALIQDAAVIGKVFWGGALAAMSGLQRWTVEEQLHALERKEFVRRDRRSSVATETEYAFRHVLVRDVAYGQVPRSTRSEKHRLAAEWIETLSSDREDRAEMLAHHYLRALEFARAAGQGVDSISERAFVALREAGDRSFALSAFRAGTDFYREALELAPEDDSEKGRLLLAYGQSLFWADWTSAKAEILEEASRRLLAAGQLAEAASAEVMVYLFHWYRGEREKAMPHFEQAARLVEEAPRSRQKADVLTDLARFAMLDDGDAAALELGREALSMAEEFGLEGVRARILNTLGVVRVRLGEHGGLADIESSLEASVVGSPERLRGFINLGTMLDELGELGRSRPLYEEGLREAERAGAAGPVRWLRAELFMNEYLTGRWQDALAHAEAFLAEAETLERHYMNASAYWVRAPIRFARGDEPGAIADAEHALSLGREAQDPQVLFPSIVYHSHLLFEAGRSSDAAALLDEILERLRSHPTGIGGEWLVPLAFAAAATDRGNEAERVLDAATNSTPWVRAARAFLAGSFVEAAEIFAEIEALPKEAFSRLRAAQALAEAGRRAEADAQLNMALAFYRSVGATRYIREAEALFAESA
jgi:class 3 adenylate cyclase/tetratricopeptide (TPR) repeat protein